MIVKVVDRSGEVQEIPEDNFEEMSVEEAAGGLQALHIKYSEYDSDTLIGGKIRSIEAEDQESGASLIE